MTAHDVLQRSSLFKDFTETGLKIFAAIAVQRTVAAGTPLFVENMVGAGALVPPGMKVPPRTLVVGTPARVKRALSDAEVAHLRESAARYVEYAARYRDEGGTP